MRKFLIIGAIVLVAVAAHGSATAVQPEVSVAYDTCAPFAPDGVLKIYNAEGRHFAAFDAHGCLVLDGHVNSSALKALCPNGGPDSEGAVLHVQVEPGVWFSLGSDDPEEWHWD